jgi:hypothetical protein
MDYAAHAARMDAGVDSRLGDSISYDSGAGFRSIKGFVIDVEPDTDMAIAGIDPLPQRKRIKIAIDVVPEVRQAHRIQSPLLGAGTFRPRAGRPRVEGRYNLFEVERV